MSQITTKIKVQHIESTTELGYYLRGYRRMQDATISIVSSFGALGERFISEHERGKETAFFDKTLQYINLLGLSLHIYPRNVLSIQSPHEPDKEKLVAHYYFANLLPEAKCSNIT